MSIFAGDNIRSVPPIAVNQTDAAKALGVNPSTLKAWERQGKIRGSRPGGKIILYLVEDLKRLARTGSARPEDRKMDELIEKIRRA